jgi:hypothetical protein
LLKKAVGSDFKIEMQIRPAGNKANTAKMEKKRLPAAASRNQN